MISPWKTRNIPKTTKFLRGKLKTLLLIKGALGPISPWIEIPVLVLFRINTMKLAKGSKGLNMKSQEIDLKIDIKNT